MARTNMDAWIPEERGSTVLQTISQVSAVELLARRESMNSETKFVPRSGGVDVSVTPKGAAYAENDNVDSEVLLTARKFTGLIRIAEEDIDDIPENVVAIKQNDWAKAYAVRLDNAALAVTGAENGTTVPFTSVYRALSTADAGLGYTANANIVKSAGVVTYDQLSAVLGLVETSDYFGELVVIAHPTFKGAFRSIKDSTGAPVFVQGLAGTPDTLFGYSVAWSRGAKTSATNSEAPNGNPILVVAEKEHLILGDRGPVESAVIDGFTGASALTDEALIKMRSRKGFVLGHPNAAAILEITAS